MDKKELQSILLEEQLINDQHVTLEPLTGGVSSDIYRITDGVHTYVVKEALPKLQVQDDWYADTARNAIEQEFIQFLRTYRPDAVPKLVYSSPERQFFVMEYLDHTFKNWKQQLLKGTFETSTATRAAELLSDIHLKSRNKKEVKHTFNNKENFHSLRIEPYLLTTGQRHPKLKEMFLEEAARLEDHQEALIHGDFSPKNIILTSERLVLLDHEVAWYGDPAFDVAFLLNHLYLKMLVHYRSNKKIEDLTQIVWDRYTKGLKNEAMEHRMGRLLLMLMLARVDGKSPVEYLQHEEKEWIRVFVHELLPKQQFSHAHINDRWKTELQRRFS